MKSDIQAVNNIFDSPPDVNLNFEKSLAEYILDILLKHKNNIAQIDSATGKEETYNVFLDRIISISQALKTKGIKPNDVVAYCCFNNMDYVAIYLAALFIGAKFSGFDVIADGKEIAHYINLSNPKIIFCDKEAEGIIESGIKLSKAQCDIILFTENINHMSLTQFIEKFKSDEKFEVYKDIKLNETSCIMFTSGTSGPIKGTEISGYALYYGALLSAKCIPNISRTMIFTLTSWVSNITYVFANIIEGCTRVIYKNFDKDTYMKYICHYKVNVTVISPVLVNVLIKFPDCYCHYDTSHVIYVMFGGGRLDEVIIKNIMKIFPNSTLLNCFGMTELASIFFVSLTNISKFDSQGRYTIGKPTNGLAYKVANIETGETLGPNQQGELRIKYLGIMNGYVNEPEITAQAFDEDGFFKTGDIVYYDENNLFYVVDRLKEIFKYQGRSISPSLIENTLFQHPAVKDVVVVPIPHEKGEVPLACIELQNETTASEQDFIKYVEERMSTLYYLRGGVKFVTKIPRNSRGKIQRNILKTEILMPGFTKKTENPELTKLT